jgi:hypothetical protein
LPQLLGSLTNNRFTPSILAERLAARFPLPIACPAVCWILSGTERMADPAFQQVSYAGELQLSQQRHWWQYSTGLQYGVWLVQVLPNARLYRLEQEHCTHWLDWAMRHFHHQRPLDWQLIEPYIETYLPRLLKNISPQSA